jgi:TonB-dependent receptor
MHMRQPSVLSFGRLLSSVAVSAAAGVAMIPLSSAAWAQEATTEVEAEPEAIIVSGQRRSLEDAVNRQRDSDFIVSALSADDVGALPDQNVAEATRRLPGISVENDQGEGRFIVLRGLDANLNATTINGLSVPSPQREGGRAVALDTIPSELLSSLIVHKTFRPDLDGDAVGGVVEIETASAFSRPDGWFTARAEGSYNELQDKWSPRFSVGGSTRFGGDRFGVAAALSYFDRSFGSENNEVDVGWGAAANSRYPIEPEQREYVISRKRIGGALNLDFQATDNARLFIRSLYSDYSDLEYRNRNEYLTRVAPASTTATSALFSDRVRIDRDVKDRTQTQRILALQAGAEIEGEKWSLNIMGGYSSAEEDELDRIDATFRREFRPALVPGFQFEIDYANPRILQVRGTNPASQAAITDPTLFPLTQIDLSNNTVRDKEWSGRIDFRRDMDAGYLKAGARLRLRDRTDDLNQSELTGAAIPAGTLLSGFLGSVDYGLSNFGPAVDPRAIRAFVDQRRGAFVLNPLDSSGGDYKSSEDVYAGYVMGQVETGIATITGGVRVEHTKFDTSGFRVETVPAVSITPISASREYTDWLPSLGIKLEPMDKFVLRGAVSRSISRPLPDASGIRFAVDDDEASIGNPDLDPFRSWNFDLIAEYYPSSSNVISAGFFHKRVSNYIVFRDVAGEPGFTAFSSAIRPENGGTAKITGFEFNIQQTFDMLPSPLDGLLLSANYANIDGKVTDGTGRRISLPKLSKHIGNIAVGYEKWGLSLRAALSYRSKYLDIINNLGYDDRFVQGHKQIDLSASYSFAERYEIYAEASNINDRPFVATFSRLGEINAYERYGPTYAIGLRVTLK